MTLKNKKINLIRWEGELDGKVGNFPSLVVDECDENGEPLTEPEEEEEDDDDFGAPPAGFGLPPTVPAHLLSQEDLAEINQHNQAAIERKFEIDLSQPQSKPPQFPPPSGNNYMSNECHQVNYLFSLLIHAFT